MSAPTYSESQRMEIRTLIHLASEAVSYYWPMRTFVHHNPLHGLEDLPFEKAVGQAARMLGGNGYLPSATFREYYHTGRILPRHLDAALRQRAHAKQVKLGVRDISHLEVLRACLLGGLSCPSEDIIDAALARHSDRDTIRALAQALSSAELKPRNSNSETRNPLVETLAAKCDRMFGTQIVEQINCELIKWCAAFLDEGHATWAMPCREHGFYQAWKFLAAREWSPCGIKQSREKLARLPAQPEDAVLATLDSLGIESETRENYLSLQLAALAGWTGFIKWRADQSEYAWQSAYPIDLVQYLAVRLWYERELVQSACRCALGMDGNVHALELALNERAGFSLPESTGAPSRAQLRDAWRLSAVARALALEPALLTQTQPSNLALLLKWIDDFPEAEHGPVWLKAFEAGYREQLLDRLGLSWAGASSALPATNPRSTGDAHGADDARVRPQAQAVFCIDVRSEPLRRNLEATGDYETYAFAGFFAVPIRHQALGSHHETDQFPVILKHKNSVREIPRTYHGKFLLKSRRREKLLGALHTLLYDLKENVFTPYVMVESLGWFYSLPFVGKTLFPARYRRAMDWLRQKLVPPVATTLTVDKLAREEVEEMLAAEQRAVTRRALQEQFGERNLNLSLERLEFLRRRALDEESAREPLPAARSTALSREEEAAFVDALRRDHGINQGASFARMERITRAGFTLSEQVLTVETVLRVMGLTRNFARLVLFCGHGSRSENNPFEAALDCGACGGNPGKPNARVIAIMANKAAVREALAKNGIAIPQDTYFIAGQHNTTTDEIELFDLEDLPPTHRKDILQLIRDLERAGARNVQERCAHFPEIGAPPRASKARRETRRRSNDWSQVQPEWGLSGNAAFIIGHRDLTRGVHLDGRVFLHSYDYRSDPDGRMLEAILTGPQVVGQWINMEHYFSTVDQEVYGSGSKIYHNVVGRLGIMSGAQSDLRTGLAWQTVMNGARPYHEALRLLTLIEAPRERIARIISNQRLLQRLYGNEWLHLIAIEPEERLCYFYLPQRGWSTGAE
ncbi:MAG: DUF2309 domain-containing protein [Chloroflexota bacterium]